MKRNLQGINFVVAGLMMAGSTGVAVAQSNPDQSPKSTRVVVTTAGGIAERPSRYYGQEVQVTAEVAEVFGRAVFTLDEDEVGASPDVLVVAPGGAQAPRDGSVVTVIGTLRPFVTSEVYNDYDWYGHGWYGYRWYDYNDVWATWQQRPVIVARSIQTQAGRELAPQRKEGTRQARTVQRVYTASPGAIADDPNAYFGHRVRSRSEVADVYGPKAFTLDEDRWFAGPDVLVLVPQSAAQAEEGSTVTVTGPVRRFNARQFERDYDWFDREAFAGADLMTQWERDQRPVIVAESVRTQSGRELVQRPQAEAAGGTGSGGRSN